MAKKKSKSKRKVAAARKPSSRKPAAQQPTARMAESAPILPPPLGAEGQIAASIHFEAAIYEASTEPLDDGLPRDTLVDPPKMLVEEEHRSGPRVTLEVDVDLASDSHFFTGLSGDISEGGLFVSTYRNVDVGSEVELEFSLPNGAVATRGLVRWQRDASPYGPPGFGIQFDVLTEEDREKIHEFCATRAPLYYEVEML
jgi:uncharacterized protein (TIGR02266 family)